MLKWLLGNLFSTFSTLLIPRKLVHAGFDATAALGLIGKFNGMALNSCFPIIVIASINSYCSRSF